MRAFTYIGTVSILYILYKYISDATRRGDPKRTETLHPPDTSSPSSSNPRDNYDVFLSFTARGGTWTTFTSHLYKALEQKGIDTFLDVKRLERGKDISPGLDNAIKSSRCAVVVLSEKYTSSHWCMEELVQILKCRNDSNIKQIVLPIFYHVNPDDIRKEEGRIWKGFQSLKQEFPIGIANNKEKVKSWGDALKELYHALKQLPGIAGYSVGNTCTDEAKFIEDFIKNVSRTFFDAALSNISKDFVGKKSRLKKLNSCVSSSPDGDVRFIGICGLGGLGKTALARAYFEEFYRQFDGSCSFLAKVRDACKNHNGIVELQKQLLTDISKEKRIIINDVGHGMYMIQKKLHRKKVLIILDDVNQLDQLEGLAKEKRWFGSGSRIIITTRNASLLSMYQKEKYIIHNVDELNYSEAHQLFCSKALKREYRELYKEVIEYASGLPLALVELGSLFCGKSRVEEQSAFDRLKKYPYEKIMGVLRISFEDLEKTEENIFLDIACFFNGFPTTYVKKIMDSCGFFAEISITTLVDKSLLHMDGNILQMHDLLEEMGKEIVREKSRNEPGRQSRIWRRDDFIRVMNKKTEPDAVEAIVCPGIEPQNNFTLSGFSNMKNLRLLIIYVTDSVSSERNRHGLIELILTGSSVIERLWDDTEIEELLGASQQIIKLENFSLFPNLKKLILNWCNHLVENDPSIKVQLILNWCNHLEKIGQSKKALRRVNLLGLEYCNLKSLPTSTGGLKSLKVLILYGDSSHRDVPEGLLYSNEELDVTGTSFRKRSKSLGSNEDLDVTGKSFRRRSSF